MKKISHSISKTAVAIGGFIIILGVIFLGTFSLIVFNIFDPSLFFDETMKNLLILGFLFLGLADLACGILLLIRD